MLEVGGGVIKNKVYPQNSSKNVISRQIASKLPSPAVGATVGAVAGAKVIKKTPAYQQKANPSNGGGGGKSTGGGGKEGSPICPRA